MTNTYVIKIIAPTKQAHIIENIFEDIDNVISRFKSDKKNFSDINIFYEKEPNKSEIAHKITILSNNLGVSNLIWQIEEVENKDWVLESQKSFTPISLGDFYIYPSWHKKINSVNIHNIKIDPAQAFGTGTHESTKGCLLLLNKLYDGQKLANNIKILDLGCGSGILAICAAKLLPNAQIFASDNDQIAVKTTIDNAKINNVIITSTESEGFANLKLQEYAPFNLIFANILAKPLIALAPQINAHLNLSGLAIISGITKKQAREVTIAFEHNGFKLIDHIILKDWQSLVLKKNYLIPKLPNPK